MSSPAEKIDAVPAAEVGIAALAGIPHVRPGDDIADIILQGLASSGMALQRGDIVVIAQKIVSKAEGRMVDLRSVMPSARATELAAEVDKDPRLVEMILRESTEVVRHRKGVLVVAHRNGTVLANAGIDASNVAGDDHHVLLLPQDCDRSCREIRARLAKATGIEPGAAGLSALLDLRGAPDLFGRGLRSTQVGIADEIAAAASLLMGQADEGTPVVVLRGVRLPDGDGSAADLHRARELDLFR
jgi:coenzyme F420-0:L-glutamate ligase/coenzyme F420-1:gamma-L-glutamate ligase